MVLVFRKQVRFSVISSNMPTFSERYKNRKQHGVSAPMERPEVQEVKTEVPEGGAQTSVATPTQGDMTNARVAMGNEASKVSRGDEQIPVVTDKDKADATASTDDDELPQMPNEGTWDDARAMVEQLGYKLESDEDKKRRLKMEAIRKMRSGISDGMRSLASAFFVTHGGLPTYDPDKGLLKKAEEDIKESDAKREKSDAEYRAVLERAKERMRDTAYKKWDMAMQAYKTRMENKRAKETAERDERRYQHEFNKYNTAVEQWNKEFDEKKRANKVQEQQNWAKISKMDAEAKQSAAAKYRYNIAAVKAWGYLETLVNSAPEQYASLAAELKSAGNPRFDSRGRQTGNFNPTIEDMLRIITKYPEAMQIFEQEYQYGSSTNAEAWANKQKTTSGGQGPVAPKQEEVVADTTVTELPTWNNPKKKK